MNARRLAILGLFLLFAPAVTRAEVTRVDIQRREDVLGGKSFGNTGPYEKLVGRAYFAVDPKDPRNRIIVDLDKAPLNAQGKVEFSSDLYILKPKDPSRGNGVLFFDIVNRGNKALLGVFSRGPRTADPTTEADFGDAYLLRQGYTLVAVGWQFDVAGARGLIGMQAPIATENGNPITGWVKMWFIPDKPVPSFAYATASYNTRAYPPLDLNDGQYRLTERAGIVGPARLISRDEWQFARWEGGKAVPDASSIYLKPGFEPGTTYEVAYETKNPPVAGLGMAAIRDMASALKDDAGAERGDGVAAKRDREAGAPGVINVAPGRYAYMYGASQTGRFIRQIIYDGFTIDEQGRKAFDGAFVQTGAAGFGSFNERFAQPNELGSFTQTKFPFLYRTTIDPITGRRDGLGARIPAGLEPKMMLVDSASEYWDRGRVAALRHTSIDGRDDVEDAPNVRVYLLAGTRHGAGSFPPADNGGQFKENTNDYRWAQRGLLAALDAWVRQGTEPPASRHPRRSDRTLVAHKDLKFPAIPGVQWPQGSTPVPGGYRADVPGPFSVVPFMLPRVDADGNDMAGIRLPEQAVPLATLTGWQFRSERIGAPNLLIAMAGAYIPFPATRAERERTRDPRLSIAERYRTKADYVKKIRDAATSLAEERYILREDIAAIVQAAERHWDFRMAPAATTNQAAR